MKKIANILWLLTFGWLMALLNTIVALVAFLSIIFIPVGFQFFKLARFSLTPFGYDFVEVRVSGFKTFVNIIWAIFFGWEIMLGYLATGLTLCITIIFIPFGLQYFKVAFFTLLPLGTRVKKVS